ncbi:MAG TPA: ribonuclease E/G, partial [Alphaproteobacteria bacterium]|nr:ribonuclease E/G [Alphaproteobacteria bacterium]
ADNGADFDADDERERKRRFDKFRKHYSIQEVISRRQILLVQVVKEERGNKGAALTTYMSLAGRYCVLMPNTYHNGGVSRKISDPADRKKLKTIVNGLNVPSGMAVIVRTAGSKRTKAEITRDYNYLLRQWNDIREKTLESSAPTIIHEEGNLIKRSIRDYYTSEIEEVIVEGDDGYKAARAHMKNLMPTHVKKIKQYKDEVNHLFQAHHVENMIAAMYEPEVTLKSGGYIVINQTEALVAIDVNSGKATRERNIEETALKTNVEAAVEIARQLKLRDLSGLVVIDFIDMEVTRNKNTVERKLKEALKADRARVQIGSISQFGLLEMSRQRLRPSLSEAVSDICPHCHGTGRIRSVESAALAIIHQIEAEVARKSRKKLTVAMAAEVALYILNHKRDMILDLETRYDLIIVLDQDNSLLPPDIRFDGISEKQEQPERKKAKPEPASNGAATHPEAALSDDDEENKPKRRRRRGKRGGRRRNRRDEDTADTAVAENNNGEANVASGAASNDTANDDAANGD